MDGASIHELERTFHFDISLQPDPLYFCHFTSSHQRVEAMIEVVSTFMGQKFLFSDAIFTL
jgi:hypothetical protein